MIRTSKIAFLSAIGGVAVGALAVQTLHAQSKPPAFYIALNDISNPAAYIKEFASKSTLLAKKSGAKFLIQGGKVTPLTGKAPTARIVVEQWESMDKLEAWFKSPENQELQKVGNKYAKINAFAVEGVAQ
jgi:uncharacterized protein (DUF1330 family)